jgi:hypothetical protein
MLLNTIVKTVKRKSHRGDQSITTDSITADIIACVNEAMREVQRLIPLQYFFKKGTITVSSGTQAVPHTLTLPTDTQELIGLWYSINSAYYKLRKVESDAEWLGGVWDTAASPNLPLFYREVGLDTDKNAQIEIFPMSNQSFTLNVEYYRTKTADLTTADLATELPDFPDQVQDAIEKGALYYFLLGFDDATAEQKKRDYEAAKLALRNEDDLNQDGMTSFRWNRRQYLLPGFRLNS